jgi:hypothetical protein
MDEFRHRRRLAHIALAATFCCTVGHVCAVERTTAVPSLGNMLSLGWNGGAPPLAENSASTTPAKETKVVRATPKILAVPEVVLPPAEQDHRMQAAGAPKSLADLINGIPNHSVVRKADPVTPTPDLELAPKVKRVQIEPIVVPNTPLSAAHAGPWPSGPIRAFRMVPIQTSQFKSKSVKSKSVQAKPASAKPAQAKRARTRSAATQTIPAAAVPALPPQSLRAPLRPAPTQFPETKPAEPLQELPIPTRPYPQLPAEPIPGNPTEPLENEPIDRDEVIAVRDPGMIESLVKMSQQRPASRSPLDVADTGAGNLVPVENLRAKPPVYQPASLKSLLSKSKVRPEPQRAVITWETTTAALEIDTPAMSNRLRRIARIQGFDPLHLESISDESAGTLLQTGGEPLPSPSAQISGGLRGIAQESLPVSYQQLQR